MPSQKVAIVLRYVHQYRLPFLLRLHEKCMRAGIDLRVIYGDPTGDDVGKSDHLDFAPGIYIKNKVMRVGKTGLIWQPILTHLRDRHLIILEQQSKLLLNYLLIARQVRGMQRIAFFGHGRNLQAESDEGFAERVKKRISVLPHWWFAYTEGVAEYLIKLGYPATRITVFNNAVDTRHISRLRASISDTDIEKLKRDLDLPPNNIGIYVGSMGPEKRMEFLLDACSRIKANIPDFSMLFVGGGLDAHMVIQFCKEHRWATYLGPLFGRDMVLHCMAAQVLLMPGAVGLAILDAFAIGLPVVTTNTPFHGPEIAYLADQYNGVMVTPSDDLDGYASAVAALLLDSPRRTELAQNGQISAACLTVENMTDRFFDGITRALATESVSVSAGAYLSRRFRAN